MIYFKITGISVKDLLMLNIFLFFSLFSAVVVQVQEFDILIKDRHVMDTAVSEGDIVLVSVRLQEPKELLILPN